MRLGKVTICRLGWFGKGDYSHVGVIDQSYFPYAILVNRSSVHPVKIVPLFLTRAWVITEMSNSKMPSALARQNAMIQTKFPPAQGRDDDAQSVAGSVSSWVVPDQEQAMGSTQDPWNEAADSDGLQLPPADLRLGAIPEHGAADQQGRGHTAPVTQAARNWVDHENETPAQRRLRKEQEKAERRGNRRVQWKQLGAHNAVNVTLPKHIQQVGSGDGERSVLVLDSRDQRMQSPYQGWLLDEIITNAYAGINVLSDRRLVRSPSSGYHLNLFMLKTLDGQKLVLCGSMTSYGGVPCGAWDAPTGSVLSHPAFQPFRWPLMSEESPTWVDVKVKLGGHLLVHLELRGYRSDQDMSVQLHHVAESLQWLLHAGGDLRANVCGDGLPRLSRGGLFMGSGRKALCRVARRCGRGIGLSAMPLRTEVGHHIMQRCFWDGRRSAGISLSQCS